MPKLSAIVEVEEKEYRHNPFMTTAEVTLSIMAGEKIKAYNKGQKDYSNKSVKLDEKKMHSIVRANFATIFQVSITMEEIIKRCNNVVSALKDNEDKIIVEVKG